MSRRPDADDSAAAARPALPSRRPSAPAPTARPPRRRRRLDTADAPTACSPATRFQHRPPVRHDRRRPQAAQPAVDATRSASATSSRSDASDIIESPDPRQSLQNLHARRLSQDLQYLRSRATLARCAHLRAGRDRLLLSSRVLARSSAAAVVRRRRGSGVGRSRRLAAACRASRWSGCRTRRCAKVATACARRFATPGFPFPPDARHRQPRAGGRAQGRRGVRSADRARHSRGRRACCPIASRRRCTIVGGLSLDGGDSADAGAAADRRRGAARAAPALMFPGRQSRRSRHRRGPAALSGAVALRGGAGARRRRRPSRRRAPAAAPPTPTRPRRRSRRRARPARSAGARSRSPRPARITCCSAVRRAPARRCWRGGCRGCCRRSTFDEALAVTTIHSVAGSLPPGGGLIDDAPVSRAASHVLGRRARRRRQPCRGPASSAWRTAACCFSTSCRSSAAACSRRCVSRSNRASCTSRARRDRSTFPGARHARRRDESRVRAASPATTSAPCRCTPAAVERYQRRLSGPLRDRFDLRLDVPRGAVGRTCAATAARPSRRRRSGRASSPRASAQLARQGVLNAQLEGAALRAHCQPADARPTRCSARRSRGCG